MQQACGQPGCIAGLLIPGAATCPHHPSTPHHPTADEEDEVKPAAGRRRGGAGMLQSTAGGRSQPAYGGFGTGSQQVSKGGWGEMR